MIRSGVLHCLMVFQIIAAEREEHKPSVKISLAFSDGFKTKKKIN